MLYSTFTVEANYWQTQSIAWPLCNSRATCSLRYGDFTIFKMSNNEFFEKSMWDRSSIETITINCLIFFRKSLFLCTHFGVDKTVLNQDLTWILGNIFSSNRVIDRLNSVDQDVLMHRAGTVSKIDWIKLNPQGWVSSWTSPLNPRPCHVGWPQDKAAQGITFPRQITYKNMTDHVSIL